ncbi:MAG: RidA family protein [Candidatus Zhuqueibacterota bacterium]
MCLLLTACSGPTEDSKKVINSPRAPKAIGPYSQAIQVGNTLYCSGQIAMNPETGELVQDSIEAETKQVLDNLGAVLQEAGMDYSDVVSATVFMSNMEFYKQINDVYARYFTEKPPARAAVQVANLPKYVNVEIACIAVKSR